MEKEVKNCKECPFQENKVYRNTSLFCGLAKQKIRDRFHPAAWCPLRKEPITIKLKS